MPMYEYVCKDCKINREEIQGYDDPPPTCEKCKKVMKKVIGVPNFALKGDGWYKDHYGLKKPKKASNGH